MKTFFILFVSSGAQEDTKKEVRRYDQLTQLAQVNKQSGFYYVNFLTSRSFEPPWLFAVNRSIIDGIICHKFSLLIGCSRPVRRNGPVGKVAQLFNPKKEENGWFIPNFNIFCFKLYYSSYDERKVWGYGCNCLSLTDRPMSSPGPDSKIYLFFF